MDANTANETVRVIGVRFRTAGKVYYFDPGEYEMRMNSAVIVETARGVEFGTVVGRPMDVPAAKINQPLKGVLRIATPEDIAHEAANRSKEKEAYRICQQKIREHNLEMKLISAEYTFDNSKVLFYFTADGRVDFRDLVKDLASVFRTRIELRQIGVRDETKILGGYGICGRPLCCHTWMSDFIPVSIKMAKEQNLSLNPGKISGVCGRLMCCLKNEAETYEELNRNLPRVGDEVQGSDGFTGQVEGVNVLRQTVRILTEVDDEKEYHEYPVEEITVLRRRRRGGRAKKENSGETAEIKELEKLEEMQGAENAGGRSSEDGRKRGAENGRGEENAGTKRGADGAGTRRRNRSDSGDNRRNAEQDGGAGRKNAGQNSGESTAQSDRSAQAQGEGGQETGGQRRSRGRRFRGRANQSNERKTTE